RQSYHHERRAGRQIHNRERGRKPLSRIPLSRLIRYRNLPRLAPFLAFVLSIVCFAGCGPHNDPHSFAAKKGVSQSAAPTIKPGAFVNITEKAGIHFKLDNGEAGEYMLVSTTPGGCAFVDYDQDGFQDSFLVQGGPAPGAAPAANRPHCALYRNLGNGTFRDVSEESGVSRIETGFAQAVAVGDYDNDGFPDLYVTAIGGN